MRTIEFIYGKPHEGKTQKVIEKFLDNYDKINSVVIFNEITPLMMYERVCKTNKDWSLRTENKGNFICLEDITCITTIFKSIEKVINDLTVDTIIYLDLNLLIQSNEILMQNINSWWLTTMSQKDIDISFVITICESISRTHVK